MRNIFTRQQENNSQQHITANQTDASIDKEFVATFKNVATAQEEPSAIYFYVPIYELKKNEKGNSIFKVAKCQIANGLVFTGDELVVESGFADVGLVYSDEALATPMGDNSLESSIKNLVVYLQYQKQNGIEQNICVASTLERLVIKYTQEEKVKLNDSELLDFNIDLKDALHITNNTYNNVVAFKQRYAKITQNRVGKEIGYMPLFFILDSNYQLATISFKCCRNNNDKIVLTPDYIVSSNFNRDKVGNIYKDDKLSEVLTSNGIIKKLSNLNCAREFAKNKELKIVVKDKMFNAENEIKKSIYFIAQNWLAKEVNFVEQEDNVNAKLIIAQVPTLKPEQVIENLYKLRDNINYRIIDAENGIRVERKKRKVPNTKNEIEIDMRDLTSSDVQIMGE